MIIDVLVAQSRAKEALAQQFLHRVVHPVLVASVVKTQRQFGHQPEVGVHLPQQQRARIGGKGAAGKIGHDFSAAQVLKQYRLLITVCSRRNGEWCFHLA